MKVINNYRLKIPDSGISQEIEMPTNAEIISVQVINNQIYIYCIVNGWYIDNMKIRVINIIDTGEEMEKYCGIYVGTAVINCHDNVKVLHVFDYGYNK